MLSNHAKKDMYVIQSCQEQLKDIKQVTKKQIFAKMKD